MVAEDNVNTNAKTRRVVLWGDITSANCQVAAEGILSLAKSGTEPIDLAVNSRGGSLDDCLGLIDIMRLVNVPVNTLGFGAVMSAGLLIVMAGKERRISEFASILSHQYSYMAYGNHGQLVSARKDQDWAMERIVRHYRDCTGKSESYIRKHLLRDVDTWLTPPQARRHGLCDQVVKRLTV